ncbi:MAG: terminase large subunit [Gammaproteobacteria bacterium]|nr:terminase large subunit [Gammaproteobacteria bacterium]
MIIDKDRSQKVIDFIEKRCTFTAGKWAGQPFKLIPWERELINKLFGTLKNDGETRQYRTCYVEIAKKNGKTELCAAIALNMLLNDGEKAGECYSGASDTSQAGLVAKAAFAMVRQDHKLNKRLDILESRKRIIDHETNSFYQVLSSESYTKHGLNPSLVIIDELHAHPNDELYNVLTSGTDYAREQQIVLIVTTAGVYDPTSVWWRIRDYAIKVSKGIINDETFLPILYLADKDDDPNDEHVWMKANPSCGYIFHLDKIRADWKIAKESPIERNNFKRFRLNIPTSSLIEWIEIEFWNKCKLEYTVDDLRGRKCYAGLDLSEKFDLSALLLLFPPIEYNEPYKILAYFWLPQDNIEELSRKSKVNYQIWADQGWIELTQGNVIDYDYIIRRIEELSGIFEIAELGYDRHNATQTIIKIDELQITETFDVSQAITNLNECTRELEAKIKRKDGKKIAHNGNPILTWMISNVLLRTDANNNYAPDKRKSTAKIDGISALLNAMAREMLYQDDGDPQIITV